METERPKYYSVWNIDRGFWTKNRYKRYDEVKPVLLSLEEATKWLNTPYAFGGLYRYEVREVPYQTIQEHMIKRDAEEDRKRREEYADKYL